MRAIVTRHRAGKPKPPENYAFFMAFMADTTWTVPENGWYRVWCVGKSGDGGNVSGRSGNGGGGSGGIAQSILFFKKGTHVPIVIDRTKSAFGDYMTATAGTDGSAPTAGVGGVATGGNISNENGFSGGTGGRSETKNSSSTPGGNGANGGMKGGTGGTTPFSNRYGGGGGAGGARLPAEHCPYVSPPYTNQYTAGSAGRCGEESCSNGASSTLYPALSPDPSMLLFGGGGGRGGNTSISKHTGSGGAYSVGTPGIIIIEKGA